VVEKLQAMKAKEQKVIKYFMACLFK
ncbi:MAG: hypothetical protein RLZZ328_228, partial [Bacteroidota bacterium]